MYCDSDGGGHRDYPVSQLLCVLLANNDANPSISLGMTVTTVATDTEIETAIATGDDPALPAIVTDGTETQMPTHQAETTEIENEKIGIQDVIVVTEDGIETEALAATADAMMATDRADETILMTADAEITTDLADRVADAALRPLRDASPLLT